MPDLDRDWRAAADVYRQRLLSMCWWTAFAGYVAGGLALARLLEIAGVSEAWMDTLAMVAWLPLGASAWWLKNRLEDWAVRL